jgi:thiazole tautomerase (transcriptional regulator TenI)
VKKVEFHVITDGKQTVNELTMKLTMLHQDVDYIHIREKQKTASDIMLLVSNLLERGVPKEKLVINDRLDVALLHTIPNVHLPGHGLPIEKVRAFDSHVRIGRSVHSLEEALRCEEAGADYLLFGHIFETNSKAALTPRGVEQLAEICEQTTIPVIAIGGITPNTINLLTKARVHGVAVMSYVIASSDPIGALTNLKDRLIEGGYHAKTI